MAVTVRIPTQLRSLVGRRVRGLDRGRDRRRAALKALDAQHPGFSERLFDDKGQLRRFVNVFVADEDIRFLHGVDTPVAEGQPSASSPPSPGADPSFGGSDGPPRSPVVTRQRRARS